MKFCKEPRTGWPADPIFRYYISKVKGNKNLQQHQSLKINSDADCLEQNWVVFTKLQPKLQMHEVIDKNLHM
jgi:hypothetical protein